VKAVNLIPLEERRGAAGGSSTPTYGLLGLLGLLVVAVTAWVVLSNQIGERKADLAREQGKATAAQTRAEGLKPYVAFAELSKKRVDTVTELAQTRFDWEGTMSDLARVVGGNVWITSFTGTVAPGVEVGGSSAAGGDTGSVRSALPDPAVELSGCATSNDEVVRFVSRLRAMTGVTRVTLAGATKSDTKTAATAPTAPAAGGASGGASGGSDCTQGSDRYPVFGLVIFFKPLPGGAAVVPAAGGAAPATPAPAAKSATAAPATSAPPTTGTSSPASAGGSK
jgi:Tfp pilus assembly protein PilN